MIAGGTLNRGEALLLWAMLIVFLVLCPRAPRGRWRCDAAPAERCLFVGDARRGERRSAPSSPTTTASKPNWSPTSTPTTSAKWSADAALGAAALGNPRAGAARSTCSGRSSPPTASTRSEMLDLICTLKAVGVKVSVLPRLLEVVGSSVEFDDLHGVTVMGVKRFALTRSSTRVKRGLRPRRRPCSACSPSRR